MKNKYDLLPRKERILKRLFSACNIVTLCLFVVCLAGDLICKYLLDASLPYMEEVNFMPKFMNLYSYHNPGAAYGIFSNFPVLLIIVTFLFLLIYMWLFCTKRSNSILLGISTGLILGGCVGNLYDRLILGKVRDFFKFTFVDFAVFNLADTFLTIGIILLAVYFAFIYPRELKKHNARLVKNNESVDAGGKVYTDDLDKIVDRNFNLARALRAEKLQQKKQERAEKRQKNAKNAQKTQKNDEIKQNGDKNKTKQNDDKKVKQNGDKA